MRLRHKIGAEDDILKSPYCIHIEKGALSPNDYFGNEHPLCLELGMGKGQFICHMAKQNPNINYIGIERSATIVLKAIDNYKRIYLGLTNNEDKDIDLTNKNLRLLCEDVEKLPDIISKHSIDKIYLNFSDPWPKKRHASRRLTHHKFLSLYEKLLKSDGIIEFKTDNKGLFEFSLEEIKLSDFSLISSTTDLHNDIEMSKGNIMTEYEEKWSSRGNPIYKYIIKKSL